MKKKLRMIAGGVALITAFAERHICRQCPGYGGLGQVC